MLALSTTFKFHLPRRVVKWTNRAKKLAVSAVVICISLLGSSMPLHAQNISCSGSMTGTFGNVTVPNGASCTLSDAIVGGNIQVGTNATLSVGATSTITGNVQANQCGSVLLSGAVVIVGNVQIQQCAARSGYVGPGIQIEGNFECQNNSGACVADNGAVGGNVQIQNNSSSTAADVSANVIGGNLQCQQNSPAPVDALGPNVVSGNLQGQCGTSLGFSALSLPSGFRPNVNAFGAGGPISLDNFGGHYLHGGDIPAGGAAIDITTIVQPGVPLVDFIGNELQGATIISTNSVVISGSTDLEMFYTVSFGPVTYNFVTSYVGNSGLLYKFYLTYNAADPLETSFQAAYQQVLQSFQFGP